MTVWTRPHFAAPSGRRIRIGFVALLDDPRLDAALASAEDEVADDQVWRRLSIEQVVRGNDGGRLDEALAGRAAMYLEGRDAHEQHEVARCQKYARIEVDAPDAPDLRLLGAAMITLRALAGEEN